MERRSRGGADLVDADRRSIGQNESVAGSRTTIVILGASNVQMGAGSLIAEALHAAGAAGNGAGEAQVLVAAGHGRSYGEWTRMFARGLPGIADCGLWRALASRDGEGGYAVLADMGNDLAYGAPPERIASWVGSCLERLHARGLRIGLSLVPVASIERLAAAFPLLLRSVLFPGRRFTLGEILSRGADLNARLRELAARFDTVCVAPPAAWYGLDTIHYRRQARAEAWRTLVGCWCAEEGGRRDSRGPVRIAGAKPEMRTLFGLSGESSSPPFGCPPAARCPSSERLPPPWLHSAGATNRLGPSTAVSAMARRPRCSRRPEPPCVAATGPSGWRDLPRASPRLHARPQRVRRDAGPGRGSPPGVEVRGDRPRRPGDLPRPGAVRGLSDRRPQARPPRHPPLCARPAGSADPHSSPTRHRRPGAATAGEHRRLVGRPQDRARSAFTSRVGSPATASRSTSPPTSRYFGGIVACGLPAVRMASIESLTGARPALETVAASCARRFAEVFERELVPFEADSAAAV